jgi:hypothetical protein
MFCAIYYGDKTEKYNILDQTNVPTRILIDVKTPDYSHRCNVLYSLVCKNMPWVHEVYFINYTSSDFRPDLGDHIPVAVRQVPPDSNLFQVLEILGQEEDLVCNYLPLYDCIFPIRDIQPCDLYSAGGSKRCFGMDGTYRYVDIGINGGKISLLLENSCYLKYENLPHYLIGENVAGTFVSNQSMMEDIYLLHKNEHTQMNNHNWDRQFVRIFSSPDFPETKIVDVLLRS